MTEQTKTQELYNKEDVVLKDSQIKKLQSAFNKVWELKGTKEQNEDLLKEYEDIVNEGKALPIFMEENCVYGVVFKDKGLEKWFLNTFLLTSRIYKEPNLNYQVLGSSFVTPEFASNILNILKVFDKPVKINVAKDFPVTFENQYLKFILAPRMED